MTLKYLLPMVCVWLTAVAAAANDTVEWIPDYEEGLAKARETGKPILLNIRCAPCINGRQFDARVVMTPRDSERGRLMEEYVCVRVASNSGMDIALFDRDWHNSIYFFVMNADEQIYLRYGGRDEHDAHTYLNLDSFEVALRAGLEQHAKYRAGDLPPEPAPSPAYPQEIGLLKKNVIDMQRCVECHLIEDYRMQELEQAGKLDKLTTLFRSPDIKTIGIHLDIPRGLVVAEATGAAAEAGMLPGDLIRSVEGVPVLTFGDLQHRYDKVPRAAREVTIGVEREGNAAELRVALPVDWWFTDPSFRYLTVDPVVDFEVRKLSAEEKRAHGFPEAGFACEITSVGQRAELLGIHQLRPGDIVYSVDGVQEDELTQNVRAYIKLSAIAGESVVVGVLRDGQKMETTVNTYRQYFRKAKE
jgi:serine protease Do